MKTFGACLLVILAIYLSSHDYFVRGEALQLTSMEAEGLVKPTRPRSFQNPEELRTYLEAMSKYYAFAGRPRYGKRAVKDETGNRWTNINVPVDLYDLLQPHNETPI